MGHACWRLEATRAAKSVDENLYEGEITRLQWERLMTNVWIITRGPAGERGKERGGGDL